MKALGITLSIFVLSSAGAQAAIHCGGVHHIANTGFANIMDYVIDKADIKEVRETADRTAGLVQITGKDLQVGQTEFPNRTPADPVPFYDPRTGELHIYGTQVDGTGFSYLKYRNSNELLRGAPAKLIAKDIYLPNGQLARGREAVWDTYRLSYHDLMKIFPKEVLQASYQSMGLDPGSDLHFAGIALQENGSLGRWTTDNWRRRVHVIGQVRERLQIIETPVFNEIEKGKSESAYPGFGQLPFLPGDYIGHAYGPNFKMVRNGKNLELWIISEEVTRRVDEISGPAEVTEIVARKMISPFEASSRPEDRVLLLSVNDPDGKPNPGSDRGKEMGHTKLIEGFRPMTIMPEGLRITRREVTKKGRTVIVNDPSLAKDEYFILTGSSGNFAGDDYDARVAYRKGSAIGPYTMMKNADDKSWKGFLKDVKMKYRLSWAGRGSFVKHNGQWWLLFHAADKDLKPDGSYGGVIPPNTHEYHRNLYAVPVEFYINQQGVPEMRVLDQPGQKLNYSKDPSFQ